MKNKIFRCSPGWGTITITSSSLSITSGPGGIGGLVVGRAGQYLT